MMKKKSIQPHVPVDVGFACVLNCAEGDNARLWRALD
jgi:hypothetical protein